MYFGAFFRSAFIPGAHVVVKELPASSRVDSIHVLIYQTWLFVMIFRMEWMRGSAFGFGASVLHGHFDLCIDFLSVNRSKFICCQTRSFQSQDGCQRDQQKMCRYLNRPSTSSNVDGRVCTVSIYHSLPRYIESNVLVAKIISISSLSCEDGLRI